MRLQMSIRAMLLGLFGTAIVAALALAAVALLSNARLVATQDYILNEIMPNQVARTEVGNVLGAFGERHADLIAAQNVAALAEATSVEELEQTYRAARGDLGGVEGGDGRARPLAEQLDAGYGALVDADERLEEARRENLELLERIQERVDTMDEHIREVMVEAELMAGQATLRQVRRERDLRQELEAVGGDVRALPPMLVEGLIERGLDVVGLSGAVRVAVAELNGLASDLRLVDDPFMLTSMRRNEIDQQLGLATRSAATIRDSEWADSRQREQAGHLHDIVTELGELMVNDDASVYDLRHQQIALEGEQADALTAVRSATAEMRGAIQDLEEHVTAEAAEAASAAQTAADAGRNTIIIVTLAVIGLLAVFGLRTIQRVLKPLGQMRRQMESMGGAASQTGDLSMRIHTGRDDELGRTADAFNAMMETFQSMIRSIVETADGVQQQSSRLEELSQASRDSGSRQQGETEEVAAAVNEMANTVQEVARNTQHAAELANNGRDAASHGKTVVDETTGSINRLSEAVERAVKVIGDLKGQSDGITKVLSVIQEVSEQTNLLALNAAIEAARAGEHGRGFAVVADEVRTLASRVQTSAREIEEMIEKLQGGADEGVQVMQESRQQAEHSVTQAGEAGAALETLSTTVSEISDMNTQIASAAEEQSATADTINESITRLSDIARENAESNSQVVAANEELARLAGELREMAGRFRT
ncbi:methyl-accepting chemotaxis protein [Aquisalimonas sp. 2447]|uniref:methyl-accepting chemotaxis protein n=1 Tax=Aquisalimonas sp. 2447 TaxID=2740807 RepID=UPI00143267BE|nr:methyl-accepting chemotaxis protein [Aquisalimonas sp. 2447]QIT53851.1 methyl-accepting chemotaxis protein [Aquisalimonas sp. 2447]